jgi:hypothetical protein
MEMFVNVVDVSNSKEFTREMTEQEYNQHLIDTARTEAAALENAEKEASRQSAIDKLKLLGLTEDDIAALGFK